MSRLQVPRYMWLLEYLNNRKATLEEIKVAWVNSSLSDATEFSTRTFHRDRQDIEELFALRIVCEEGRPYRYYIENNDDLKGRKLRTWLMAILSTSNALEEGRSLKERIIVEKVPSRDKYLMDIIHSMKHNRIISIEYESYWREGVQELRLEPYAIKNFRRRWYLLACASGSSKTKIYALDRMLSLRLENEIFQLPEDFYLEDYFHGSFGIIVDEEYPVEEITLRAYGVRVRYLDSLPLHHSQRKETEGEGWAEYKFRLRASIDFQQELMSYAHEVEILSPEWLRKDIQAYLKQAQAFYKTNK